MTEPVVEVDMLAKFRALAMKKKPALLEKVEISGAPVEEVPDSA